MRVETIPAGFQHRNTLFATRILGRRAPRVRAAPEVASWRGAFSLRTPWAQRQLCGIGSATMRALLQRVSEASVTIHGQTHARIGPGLVILVGVEQGDGPADIVWLARKIVQLRVFNDDSGVMNRSLSETGGDALVVSQFTLHASTRKGNRPSYSRAAPPAEASPRYDEFVRELTAVLGKRVATGVFGADMQVALVNDGPVTILIDSRARE